ncbi:MAG: hypothetical protein AAGK23_11795 [Pseudomonadota bacterium]
MQPTLKSSTLRFTLWLLLYFCIFLGCFWVLSTQATDTFYSANITGLIGGATYISLIASWTAAQTIVHQKNTWRMYGLGTLAGGTLLSFVFWQVPDLVIEDVPKLVVFLSVFAFGILGAALQLGFGLLSLKAIMNLSGHSRGKLDGPT